MKADKLLAVPGLEKTSRGTEGQTYNRIKKKYYSNIIILRQHNNFSSLPKLERSMLTTLRQCSAASLKSVVK